MPSAFGNTMNREDILAARKRLSQDEERDPEGIPLLEFFDELGSTNDRVRELGRTGAPDGSLVLAEKQTAGRGRRGRSWESPAGANIAMSILLRPRIAAENASQLTLIAALAVQRSVKRLTGLRPRIKWPNDLLLEEKKICGILTELFFAGEGYYLAVGIGLNVHRADKPPEVAAVSAALEEFGASVDRSTLAAAIYGELMQLSRAWEDCGSLSFLQEEYAACMAWRGERTVLTDASGIAAEGILRGISSGGHLLLDTDGGPLEVHTGELSLRRGL